MFSDHEISNWRDEFSSNGFVVIPGFLGHAELAHAVSNVDRFVTNVMGGLSPEQVFYEDMSKPETLKQIQQLGAHDPWFFAVLHEGRFRQLAEVLLEGPVVPKNLQYFNKPAGIGEATPPHQDGYYFMLEPSEAVTMWLALDQVDEENGCLKYIRGSHRNGIRKHARTGTLGFSQGITGVPTELDLENEVSIPAEPGDLIVHHALTIHRAGRNASMNRTRRALGFIYYSQLAIQDVAAYQAYQQQLANEMSDQGKI